MATVLAESRLVDYLYTKCNSGRVPGRRDIDPIEISREVLPNIALIGGGRPPGFKMRCRFRLAGMSIVRNFGLEVTGCLFVEVLLSPDKLKVEHAKIARVV